MNRKLYYENTYLQETECTVVSVTKTDKYTEVITDKTVFYPECGGQPGDRGALGQYEVLSTKKADNGDSVLLLNKDCPVQIGDNLNLKLDWAFRYKYMKMHTAQHLLSGLLFSVLHIGTVAIHLGEDYLTIEVDRNSVSSEELKTLITVANKKIAESHSVIYHEMKHDDAEALGLRRSIKVDGDVRIVEIEGVDRIACGGVHVAKTSELSLVLYFGCEQIRGHVRLFFKTASDALDSVYKNQGTINSIRERFSCSESEIVSKIESLLSENSEQKKKNTFLSEQFAEAELNNSINAGVAVIETAVDAASFVKVQEKYKDLALFVYDRKHWLMVLKGRFEAVDFNRIRTELFSCIGAKGGGRTPVFQGMYTNASGLPDFISAFVSFIEPLSFD